MGMVICSLAEWQVNSETNKYDLSRFSLLERITDIRWGMPVYIECLSQHVTHVTCLNQHVTHVTCLNQHVTH